MSRQLPTSEQVREMTALGETICGLGSNTAIEGERANNVALEGSGLLIEAAGRVMVTGDLKLVCRVLAVLGEELAAFKRGSQNDTA